MGLSVGYAGERSPTGRGASPRMNLKEVIKAEKFGIETGQWSAGHIPRSAFPLSKVKDRSYKYGMAYSWRVIKFTCLGRKCRVLLFLNLEKGIYRARLGVEESGDMVVLCDHEFHLSEPGWHCHFTLNAVSSIDPGSARGGKNRRPKLEDPKAIFPVTKGNAVAYAAKRYGFEILGGLI